MDKILYAFLNYRNDSSNVKQQLDKLNTSDVIISTKNPYNYKGIICLPINVNISQSLNDILEYSNKNEYNYTVIITDDTLINDINIVTEYITLSDKFKQDVLFYPYSKSKYNQVLDNIPNPVAVLSMNETPEIILVRVPVFDFVLIKNSDIRFDINYKDFFFDEFLLKHVEANKLYSFGMFMNTVDSYGKITHLNCPRIREMDKEKYNTEYQNIKQRLIFDLDITKVCLYIKSKLQSKGIQTWQIQ